MSSSFGLFERKNVFFCSGKQAHSKNAPSLQESEMDSVLENKLAAPRIHVHLTKREKEVLKFILDGNTNREIAQKLYRTERTVEYHRNRLMHKLGTHNIVELVKYAISIGIA